MKGAIDAGTCTGILKGSCSAREKRFIGCIDYCQSLLTLILNSDFSTPSKDSSKDDQAAVNAQPTQRGAVAYSTSMSQVSIELQLRVAKLN